jgi:hypothetical protein
MPEKQSVHRPAPGESLFHCGKSNQKRLAPGARRCGSSRTDPLRIWANAGRRRTRTSMCSNSGAYSLRLPAVLAVLYGALSHSARASMRYIRAFPFHPAAATLYRCCKLGGTCKWPVPVWLKQATRHASVLRPSVIRHTTNLNAPD